MSLFDPARRTQPAIRQNGQLLNLEALRSPSGLTEALAAYRGARIAVLRPSARLATSVLAATQDVPYAIALLRSDARFTPEALAAMQIAAVVTEAEEVQPTGIAARAVTESQILMETSGTTGTPKVVVHSLERLLSGIGVRPVSAVPARWMLTYPVAGFAGLQVLLTALASGDELIAVTDFRAAVIAAAAMEYGPTHMSGTPTFWRSFLTSCGDGVSRVPLRQVTLGGEIADQACLNVLRRTFPQAVVTHIYASTEAGALFSVKDGRAGFPAAWLQEGVRGAKLRIRDSVLEVESPRAMVARAEGGDPEGDSWIRTGDLVQVEGDRVYFLGREDTLINVGGSKVVPEEVERVLLSVAGVKHARVFGKANPLTGNIVAAEIVLSGATPETVRPMIQASLASLERYKQPRILTFVERIDQSETGKVSRR